jgi:hypothetical protein
MFVVPSFFGFQDAGKTVPLLDEYPGAAAAYSLRLLRAGYTGSAIRVRRTDLAESDIGFNSAGNLDTTALLAFTGTGALNNGFITTWYDQSGNGYNATQTTAVRQPSIVNAGSVRLNSGKPALFFSGAYSLQYVSVNLGSSTTVFIAGQSPTGSTRFLFDGVSSNNRFGIYSVSNTQNSLFTVNNSGSLNEILTTSKTTAGNANIFTALKNSTSSKLFENGVEVASGTLTNDSSTGLTIGANNNFNSAYQNSINEIIFYNSNQSSNRTGIETNINDFYSIY